MEVYQQQRFHVRRAHRDELNIFYDIERESALAQAQMTLVHNEKMAVLDQLVAGIAHEVNTTLGAIKVSTESLDISMSDDGEAPWSAEPLSQAQVKGRREPVGLPRDHLRAARVDSSQQDDRANYNVSMSAIAQYIITR